MSPSIRPIAALLAVCLMWGLSPLYFHLVAHIPPLEVLCYRTLWSLLLLAAVLAVQGRLGRLRAAVTSRATVGRVALAAALISVNWFAFIYTVSIGQVLEASLGYYIFPLVSVGLGLVFYREGLTPLQWAAVALAALAVVILTVGLGVAPWVALVLATSFGLYGMVKRGIDLGPVTSVTAEVLLLAPLALIWLASHSDTLGDGFSWHDQGLLALAGPVTGVPLILFAYAARRLRMSTVGLTLYLNPTLQFLCAVLFFGNVVTRWHAIALPLIWLALALYTVSLARAESARRRGARATAVATPPTP